MGKHNRSYIEIKWTDEDQVEELLNENEIEYEFIDNEDVLEWDEVRLKDADEDEIIYELEKRRSDYKNLVKIAHTEKEKKIDYIRNVLGLNDTTSVEDVVSEVNELFKL